MAQFLWAIKIQSKIYLLVFQFLDFCKSQVQTWSSDSHFAGIVNVRNICIAMHLAVVRSKY